MKILYRYILKEHLGPFLFAFLTILFVFTLQFITRFFDRFVGKGLGFFVVAELITLQVAWMVVLAVPMAVLVATLIAFGNLTNNSEMTVMKAGGISLSRLIIPVLLVGALLSVILERFNNIVLPEANYQAKLLLRDITRAKPSFGLQENTFSGLVEGYSILVRKTGDDAHDLEGITIYEWKIGDDKTVITAEKGDIEFSSDYHYLILTLFNGEMHELRSSGKAEDDYRVTAFEKHRLVFSSTGYGFERTDGSKMRRGDRELSAQELYEMGMKFRKLMLDTLQSSGRQLAIEQEAINASLAEPGSGRPVRVGDAPRSKAEALEIVEKMLVRTDRTIDQIERNRKMYNRYMVEFHKKYALSFACVVFVLVGAPLGVLSRRGGFGVGAGLSLLFFVLYWALLIFGEKMSDQGLLDPGISIWLANIVLLLTGLLALFYVSGRGIGSGR